MALAGSRALSPAMHGREAQLDALSHHLDEAGSRGGRIVFVSGEAGIGKTRLTGEFLREACSGEEVLSLEGHCYDADPAIPYGPFLDALLQLVRQEGPEAVASVAGSLASDLQPILPELAPYLEEPTAEVDPRVQTRRLFEALLMVLGSGSLAETRVVLLEDLQWSDASTRELLPFIGQRIDGLPFLLLGTYRSDELHRRHPFSKTLTSLAREPNFHEIGLAPLSPDDVAQMLETILERPLPSGFVEAFHAQTSGNPFFIEELLKSILQSGRLEDIIEAANKGHGLDLVDIPTSVAASVLMRTDSLAKDERLVLHHAAVIGRRFEFEMLQRLTDLAEGRLLDCLERLMTERLVEESGHEGDRYQFVHALTREAVYDALVQRERRRMHRRVLEDLESLHAGDLAGAADRLAYHSLMARDMEKGRTYASLAGREAAKKLAHREALAHLETALELTREDDTEERAELLYELGLVAYPTGVTRLYSRYWTDAQSLYRELGKEREAAQISLRLSRLAWERGDAPEAFDQAHDALKAYAEADQGEDVAMVHSVLSQLHMLSSRPDEAIRWGEMALSMARRVGSTLVEVHALNNLGVAHHERGDLELGLSMLRESVRLGRQEEFGFESLRAGGNLGECLFKAGELARARDVLEESLEVGDRAGLQLHRALIVANLGSAALEAGSWEEAAGFLHQAMRAPDLGLPIVALFAAPWMAELQRRRGQLEQALETLQASLPIAERHGEYQMLRQYLPVLALAHFDRGDLEELDDLLDRSVRMAEANPPLVGADAFLSVTADLLARRKRLDEARTMVASVKQLAEKTGLWIVEARALRPQGAIHESEGNWNEAAEAWRKAARLWGEHGHPYQEAVDRRALAVALAEEEDYEGARLESAKATKLLRELGAAEGLPSLRSSPAEVTESGPEDRPTGLVEELTPRETEVLQHLSLGQSNKEIAANLVISVKTVEVHVSSILGKLGVSSRTEAAAHAARQGWLQREDDPAEREDP